MMFRGPTRTQRAHQTAKRTGLDQYGLPPWKVADAHTKIRESDSRFICHIGKLTVHRMMLGDQAVFCAYDSKIGAIGFFIEWTLGCRMDQRAVEKKSALRLPSQAR